MDKKLFVMPKAALRECAELEIIIRRTYQESVTMEDAEKHAARFLGAQMMIAAILKDCDLDARMKKSGLKALKAETYMEAATQGDKKPSDTLLNNVVDTNEGVRAAVNELDEAEVSRDLLQNYMSVFKEAHVFYRGIAKGRFE